MKKRKKDSGFDALTSLTSQPLETRKLRILNAGLLNLAFWFQTLEIQREGGAPRCISGVVCSGVHPCRAPRELFKKHGVRSS